MGLYWLCPRVLWGRGGQRIRTSDSEPLGDGIERYLVLFFSTRWLKGRHQLQGATRTCGHGHSRAQDKLSLSQTVWGSLKNPVVPSLTSDLTLLRKWERSDLPFKIPSSKTCGGGEIHSPTDKAGGCLSCSWVGAPLWIEKIILKSGQLLKVQAHVSLWQLWIFEFS